MAGRACKTGIKLNHTRRQAAYAQQRSRQNYRFPGRREQVVQSGSLANDET